MWVGVAAAESPPILMVDDRSASGRVPGGENVAQGSLSSLAALPPPRARGGADKGKFLDRGLAQTVAFYLRPQDFACFLSLVTRHCLYSAVSSHKSLREIADPKEQGSVLGVCRK
jgi:hypothetical protein